MSQVQSTGTAKFGLIIAWPTFYCWRIFKKKMVAARKCRICLFFHKNLPILDYKYWYKNHFTYFLFDFNT